MLDKGFPSDFIYELKRKNDIISVISRYVQLEKKGKNHWGCCPFHHEKTPSFCVNEFEQVYHCFGCKEGGDIITFVKKMENCDFYDAIKILAKNAGMEIPELQADESIKRRKEEKDRALRLLDVAYKHYYDNLFKPDAKVAQEYIKARGLTRRELEDFKLGYSKNWNEIIDFLKSQGFSNEDLIIAGVAGEKNGRLYDVLGERLVFPIFDSFGSCVGFSGRVLGKADFAKYLNTSDTVVFSKGKVVYGIHILKKLKQEGKLDSIVIVEGQMDVIALHKAGFKNACACLGTALTLGNAKELQRFSENIILCFDGDSAGVKATLRSIEILKEFNINVKIAVLPDGKDPDEVLKADGADKLKGILDNSMFPVDYMIMMEQKNFDLKDAVSKSKFIKRALEIISGLDTASERDLQLLKLKEITKVPLDILRRDLMQKPEEREETENVIISRENGNIKAIKFILASLLYKKNYAKINFDLKKYLTNESLKKLFDFIKDGKQISLLYDEFEIEKEPAIKEIIDFEFDEFEKTEKKYFDECIWSIIETDLKQEQEELSQQFKEETDNLKRLEIAKRLSKISQRLRDKKVED